MNPPRWLKSAAAVVIVATSAVCLGDVEPVSVSTAKPERWVGQRAPFYVTLRGEGPFTGAASFSLPQVPRCVIVKVGNPVVGTEEHDGKSWYTQTHEFALFSQRDGAVEVPPFPVRFGNKKDPDSEPVNHDVETAPLTFTIKRPEGGDAQAFVVTTTDITITEQWDPPPGTAQQGAVFHRTIRQVADETTGMALAPPPTAAPEGVRVHPGRPSVSDRTERGELQGSRSDTITYVLEAPGNLSVPAIKYVWWDPDKEEFGSKTLPAVTFDVAAAPSPAQPNATDPRRSWWWSIGTALAVCSLVLWGARRKLAAGWSRLRITLNPPERAAATRLMKACRRDDASGAEAAWLQWRLTQNGGPVLPDDLRDAARELDRHLYGEAPSTAWDGESLDVAVRRFRAERGRLSPAGAGSLPRLNPTG